MSLEPPRPDPDADRRPAPALGSPRSRPRGGRWLALTIVLLPILLFLAAVVWFFLLSHR